MAGNACSVTCNVKDKDGKVQVSKLFEDLRRFFKGNRAEAVAHYFLAKDGDFLMNTNKELEFDSNGEVTLKSLKEALEDNGVYGSLSDETVRAALNEDLKKTNLGYTEALNDVLRFNRSNQFRKGFMATLNREATGKYSIQVVKRSLEEEYKLAEHIKNKILSDSLRQVLEDNGFSVEFLNEGRASMIYTVEDLQKAISVIDNEKTSGSLAEAVGHFVVGAMRENPLIQRLINQCTQEVQQHLFRNPDNMELYRPSFIISDLSAEQAAGILLGRALISKATKPVPDSVWGKTLEKAGKAILWLLKKIKNAWKQATGKIDELELNRLVDAAEIAASTAAEGFISDANVPGSLSSPKTASYKGRTLQQEFEAQMKPIFESYEKTIQEMKLMLADLGTTKSRMESPGDINSIMKDVKNLIQNVYATAESTTAADISLFAANSTTAAIAHALAGLTAILNTDVTNLIESINISNKNEAFVNLAENGKRIKALGTILKNAAIIYKTINDRLASQAFAGSPEQFKIGTTSVSTTLRDVTEALGKLLFGDQRYVELPNHETSATQGLMGIYDVKKKVIFADHLKYFYGDSFVELNAGMIFKPSFKNMSLLTHSETKKVRVEDMIESLDTDISRFDRYLSSAADCADFVTAVGNKAARMMLKVADIANEKYFDSLLEIEMQMKDVFGHTDTSIFYETMLNEKGELVKTGNLLIEFNYGMYEEAHKKKRKELKKEFGNYLGGIQKEHPEFFPMTDLQKSVLYHKFVEKEWKKWSEEHDDTIIVAGRKIKTPKKSLYQSQQWLDMFDTEQPGLSKEEIQKRKRKLAVYEKILKLKKDIDKNLPMNATKEYRAPQFNSNMVGTFRSLKNKTANMGNMKAAKGAVLRSMIKGISIKPDELWLFGSDNEFNEIEEDPLENPVSYEREKMSRLPLFGINKMPNMDDLNTDLFGTLSAYASMATTYKAMSNIADIFEVGKDIVRERNVKGAPNKYLLEDNTRHVKRYIKMVDKDIYGVLVKNGRFDPNGMFTRFFRSLSSTGTFMFLYGNLHGGLVNTGTGLFEIWKEAVAGENYTSEEFKKANSIYWENLPSFISNAVTYDVRPDDYISLWIRHWNILGENQAFYRNQHFSRDIWERLNNNMAEYFSHCMMLPYSSGEHYMQTIPFLAMGLHDKVYTLDGKEISFMDAYEVVDGEEVSQVETENPKVLGRTMKKVQLKKHIFKTPQDVNTYKMMDSIKQAIDQFYQDNPHINMHEPLSGYNLNMSKKQLDFCRELLGYELTSSNSLIALRKSLSMRMQELPVGVREEEDFILKARNICNRLHGIYNTEDKVAFQQILFGNMVLAMRGYALGMINRRYVGSKFNVPQKKVVEGSSVTALKYFVYMTQRLFGKGDFAPAKDAILMALSALSGGANNLPFIGITTKEMDERIKADMELAGFSPHQYYNMRRFFADLESVALLEGLQHMVALNEDAEDPEEVSWWKGVLYYFVTRLLREQSAFTTTSGFSWEAKTLLDYTPIGMAAFGTLLDLLNLMFKTVYDNIGTPDTTNTELYWGKGKKGMYEREDAKIWTKLLSITPYVRTYNTLVGNPFSEEFDPKRPYESTKSYEFGRQLRGK